MPSAGGAKLQGITVGTTRSAGTRQTDKKVLASHPPRHYIKSLDLITITSKMSQEDKKATLLRRMRKQKGGMVSFGGGLHYGMLRAATQ